MRLILASGSQRRRELLKMCGYDYETIVSNADEHTDEKDPEKLVRILSERKAEEVYNRLICKECANAILHEHTHDAEPETDVDLDFLIKDEIEAIDGYRKMIAKTSNPQLLSVLSHILDEETEHVEELRAAQAGVYEVEDD